MSDQRTSEQRTTALQAEIDGEQRPSKPMSDSLFDAYLTRVVVTAHDWISGPMPTPVLDAMNDLREYYRKRTADETPACERLRSILHDARVLHDEAREVCCGRAAVVAAEARAEPAPAIQPEKCCLCKKRAPYRIEKNVGWICAECDSFRPAASAR